MGGGVHKFGSLSYKFDPIPTISNQPSSQFFNGGSSDETKVMLEYWKVEKGDIVVDAGAHIGAWTLPSVLLILQLFKSVVGKPLVSILSSDNIHVSVSIPCLTSKAMCYICSTSHGAKILCYNKYH